MSVNCLQPSCLLTDYVCLQWSLRILPVLESSISIQQKFALLTGTATKCSTATATNVSNAVGNAVYQHVVCNAQSLQ